MISFVRREKKWEKMERQDKNNLDCLVKGELISKKLEIRPNGSLIQKLTILATPQDKPSKSRQSQYKRIETQLNKEFYLEYSGCLDKSSEGDIVEVYMLGGKIKIYDVNKDEWNNK